MFDFDSLGDHSSLKDKSRLLEGLKRFKYISTVAKIANPYKLALHVKPKCLLTESVQSPLLW